jgi:RNA polymerase sigma-70 factor (ECF subfamily)
MHRPIPQKQDSDRACQPVGSLYNDLMTNEASMVGQAAEGPLEAVDLERFRAYLDLLARIEVAPRLRDKVDLSGVVQQTLLEAHQGLIEHPRSDRSVAEVAGWLRSILSHNLADVLRKLTARKRDFRREWSLESALDQSASRVEAWLAAEQSSPSRKVIRQEELLRMAESLESLPEGQRRAIELHHLQGRPLSEIALELGTTKSAVAGMLHRGLKALRKRLDIS